MNRTFLYGLVAATAAIALTGCKGGSAGASGNGDGATADGTLAVVNGQPISMEQFTRHMSNKTSVRVQGQPQGNTARVAGTVGFQALEDLIRQALLKQIAQDEGVYPTEQDVLKELEYREKRRPNYMKEAVAAGSTPEEVKEDIASSLSQERVLTKGIVVTKEEASKYIKDNPDQFREPARAELLWIYVRTPQARKPVDDDLNSGQMFAQVASRYSEFPNARAQRGRFPIAVVESLPPQIKSLVEKTEELKATDWIPFQGGYAKFFVERKTAAKQIPVDDSLVEYVQRTLAIRRSGKDIEQRIMQKLKDSLDKIEVKQPGLSELWKRATANIKNADPATAGVTGGGTGVATAGTTGTTPPAATTGK